MKKRRHFNRSRVLAFTFLFGALALSCSDDFVYVNSENQNSETYFNTEEDYQNALIGAYDMLQASYINVMLGEIASANTLAGGESATDVIGIQQIDDMIHTPTNEQLRSIWSWMYAGVNRANYILEFQDKIDFDGKDNVIGQAKFLRAYYYFELVKVFGAVPLVIDKRLGVEEVNETKRNSVGEVYAQIEEDLNYAVSILPWNSGVKGRVDKGAALGLLGKTYLYQNQWSNAVQTFNTLIESGNYGLVEDYSTLFYKSNENSIETVFDVEYSAGEGGSYGCLICLEGNLAPGYQGIRGYDGPVYGDGNSYNLPTQDLYDSFEYRDPRANVHRGL